MLLHKSPVPQPSNTAQDCSRSLVRRVFEESFKMLETEPTKQTRSIRWELGACWVQHLQNQASGKTDSKKTEEPKVEPAVKGLGKQGGLLKEIKKKIDIKNSNTDQGRDVSSGNNLDVNKKIDSSNQKECETQEEERKMSWKKLLSEEAYLRLKESETGLHLKVCQTFINKYVFDCFLYIFVTGVGRITFHRLFFMLSELLFFCMVDSHLMN